MQLTVNNFRGIRHLSIPLSDQITLIAAPNAAGKTSLAQVLGAMISGTEIPIHGIAKKHARQFLHNGATVGDATLVTPHGTLTARYPDCKITGEGPRASVYAAGVKLPLLTPLELQEYIPVAPTKEELAAEFIGIDGVPIDAIWQTITAKGWDAAYERAKEKGAELKGQWRQVTGEQYGSTKAENWNPPGYWRHSVEELTEQLTNAKHSYETALKQSAVTEHQLAELKELQETPVDVFEGRLLSLKERLDLAKMNYECAVDETKLSAISLPDTCPVSCPHCGEPVVITGLKLSKPPAKKPNKKQQETAVEKYEAAKRHEAETLAAYQDVIAEVSEADRLIRERRRADELVALKSAEQIPLDQALALLTTVQEQLNAAQAKRSADELHRQIFANTQMQLVLSSDGLRRQTLQKSVGSFNALTREISSIAQWGVIELDDIDLTPTLNGKPYKLLSASEQFRVHVTLQVALAKLDGSQMLIIDAADILDRDGRNGLITLLRQLDALPSVVAMTFNNVADVPDLTVGGFGVTHWIGAKEAVTA